MRIRVGSAQVAVYPFDDRNTIILRYALSKPKTITEYIRILDQEFELTEGAKLSVKDVRDEPLFKSRTSPSLADILSLTDLYPLSREDIVTLWLIAQNPTITVNLENSLMKISNKFRPGEARSMMDGYNDMIAARREYMKTTNTAIIDQMDKLSRTSKVESEEPAIRTFQISTTVKPVDYMADLIDVFDSLRMSSILPFAVVRLNNVVRYKAYDLHLPESVWVEEAERKLKTDGIYIKLLRREEKYSTAIWNTRNMVELEYYPDSERTEESMWIDLLSAFENKPTLLDDRVVSGVKAIFDIRNVRYNDGVFWDLVANDAMVKEFIRIKEDENTAMNKEQRHMYYQLKAFSKNSIKVQLVVKTGPSNTSSIVSVHLSAIDRQQVSAVREIMERVFSIYAKKYDAIVKAYKEVLPDFMKRSPDGATVPSDEIGYRVVKSTGKTDTEEVVGGRLKLLRELGPYDMFSPNSNYSKAVTASNQPTIIPDTDFGKWLGKSSLSSKMSRIIRYPLYGDDARWYTSDDADKSPEIQINKKGRDPDTYPYLPQCLPGADYTKKKSSKYRAYVTETDRQPSDETKYVKQYIDELAKIGILMGESSDKELLTKTRYTVRFENIASDGRFGHLPRNLEEMAVRAKIATADDGLRLRRLGVKIGEDSFLHCVSLSQEKYRNMSPDDRDEYVADVRNELIGMMSEASQEVAGLPIDELKRTLESGDYVDPYVFVSVVAKYFQVNIFLYSWSRTNYHGEIVVPRHKKVHLYPGIVESQDSVFVIIYEDSNNSRRKIPQCNLVVHRDKKVTDLTYAFTSDKLIVKEAERMLNEAYKVRYLDLDVVKTITVDANVDRRNVLLKRYIPIRDLLARGVKSQFVDSYGKTRMLNYDGVSLMTPPMAPLAYVDIVGRESTKATLKTALALLADKEFVVVAQDGDEETTHGLWVQLTNNVGYVPIQPTKPLRGVPQSSGILNDPISTQKDSQLTTMRRNRKITKILKQYVLYTASIGKYDEKKSYRIRKNHTYNVEGLSRRIENNPTFYDFDNNVVIVQSDDVRTRLHAYLVTERLNNWPGIEKLADSVLLWDFYETPYDFTVRKNEAVFVSESSLMDWVRTQQKSSIPTVHYELQPSIETPYFYINYKLTNLVVMIQNVSFGDMRRALAVSRKWQTDRVNLGYEPLGAKSTDLPSEDTYKYTIYTQDGQLAVVRGGKDAYLIKYDTDKYAAVLWLNRQ